MLTLLYSLCVVLYLAFHANKLQYDLTDGDAEDYKIRSPCVHVRRCATDRGVGSKSSRTRGRVEAVGRRRAADDTSCPAAGATAGRREHRPHDVTQPHRHSAGRGSLIMLCATYNTRIRLRFDWRSTVCPRSLRSNSDVP